MYCEKYVLQPELVIISHQLVRYATHLQRFIELINAFHYWVALYIWIWLFSSSMKFCIIWILQKINIEFW